MTAVLEQEIIKKKTDHRVPSLNSFICTKQYTSKKKNYQNPWEKKFENIIQKYVNDETKAYKEKDLDKCKKYKSNSYDKKKFFLWRKK